MIRQIFSIIVMLACSAACAQNLIGNSGFEIAGLGGNPQSWEPYSVPRAGTEVVYQEDPGDAVEGQDYVRVGNTSSITIDGFFHGWEQQPEVMLEPNCRYRIGYMYRRSSADIVRAMGIRTRSGPGAFAPFDGNNFPDLTDDLTDIGVVGAWTPFEQDHVTISEAGYFESLCFGASKKPISVSALAAGNYVDYDDVRLELVERLTSGIIHVSAPWSYSVGNTSCTITYVSFSGATMCTQTVELKSGTPSGLAIAGLPDYWEIGELWPAATYEARVTLSYTDAAVTAAGLVESELTMRRSEGDGVWVEVPSTVDTTQNTITMTGTTNHFSLWAITGSTPSRVADWLWFY